MVAIDRRRRLHVVVDRVAAKNRGPDTLNAAFRQADLGPVVKENAAYDTVKLLLSMHYAECYRRLTSAKKRLRWIDLLTNASYGWNAFPI